MKAQKKIHVHVMKKNGDLKKYGEFFIDLVV